MATKSPCATPVPESGMLKLGFEPVEVMLTPPLAAPLVVGEKSTVKDVLWPAVNVKGKDSPLKLNPVPLAAAAEMVRLDPPVLVSVSDRLLLLPTWTLPNAKLEGLGESTPAVTPVPVPVPERLSTTVLFVWFAVVAKVTLPLKFPAPVGANVIVAEAELPALIVSGRARLLIENPAPLNVADVMVRLVPPLFHRLTVLVWLVPTAMFPKATGDGPGESVPGVSAVAVADREA